MTHDERAHAEKELKQQREYVHKLACDMVEAKKQEKELSSRLEMLRVAVRSLDERGRIASRTVEQLEAKIAEARA